MLIKKEKITFSVVSRLKKLIIKYVGIKNTTKNPNEILKPVESKSRNKTKDMMITNIIAITALTLIFILFNFVHLRIIFVE